jgi:hypothetical protein
MSEQAPKENQDLVMGEYSSVEQKTYKNGAVHIYGVDPSTGKRSHLSHEELLRAYGHTSKEREDYNKSFEAGMPDQEEDDLDEELFDEWDDLKESFAEARQTGDIDTLQQALANYKMYIEQFEDMTEEDKKTALKELLEGEEYVGKHEKKEGDPLYAVGDEFEQMLEEGMTKILIIESITTDENGNTVYNVVDEMGEERTSVTAEELSDFNRLTKSEAADAKEEEKAKRTVLQRAIAFFKSPGAAVSAEAQAALATSDPEKRRKWGKPVAIALGIIAAGLVVKYGYDNLTADSSDIVAGASAGAAGTAKPPTPETVIKLTETQKELLSADGTYPWERFAEVFGKKAASSEIFEAIDKLQAQGVKIVEHGARNSSQYWIEVPKPGGGMTANTDTVMRVLTKGV